MKNKQLKLTKGEIAGIRLVADIYVVKELAEHLESKYPEMGNLPKDRQLISYLKDRIPKLESGEAELARQISLVRKQWIQQIKEEW
ncbi:TPA: hypothetical protein ACRZ4F_002304 [Vibrio harveyi]